MTSPALVEQRPARVPRVDRRVGLEEDLALDIPAPIAHDSLGDRPLEAQRIADREDRVAGIDIVPITQDHVVRFQVGRQGKLEQGQVEERIQRDDLDVLDPPPGQAARRRSCTGSPRPASPPGSRGRW